MHVATISSSLFFLPFSPSPSLDPFFSPFPSVPWRRSSRTHTMRKTVALLLLAHVLPSLLAPLSSAAAPCDNVAAEGYAKKVGGRAL